ncbi:uncharacterized protein LOC117754243 [Hippoglossus hippoglossus]|uniref:uncharacterized protein LOC117754243 n=1 Tax=Hippoglossus hippoglossus TaxID=8267 RepID=UPI00148D91F7|nr:uncharacterized protein LOC117754243 [Hippoglossus hippoglossus]
MLPCSFPPGSEETVEWFRQDVVVYKFEREDDEDDDDDDSKSSSEEHFDYKQLSGRASVFPHLISHGNATLVLRSGDLKDRGTYRCHVRTSNGEHDAKVILKVEVWSINKEEVGFMTCTAASHQGLIEMLKLHFWERSCRPSLLTLTRMLANTQGLYTVDSRLRLLNGGPAWTTSLREREIRGTQGRDLTIPCSAPFYLNHPSLEWSFSGGEDPSHILTYDSRSGHSVATAPWSSHVELDGFRVPFGDGSLRLMDPKHSEHTGSYTCRFSVPYNTHEERADVIIDGPDAEWNTSDEPSYWWILGLVIAGLIVALAAMLAFLKLRGGSGRKHRNDPEEVTELQSVKGLLQPSELVHESVRFLIPASFRASAAGDTDSSSACGEIFPLRNSEGLFHFKRAETLKTDLRFSSAVAFTVQ